MTENETPFDIRRPLYEVRMGIAIFGNSNNTDEEFEAVGHNPFHPDFNDNYAHGNGNTEEEALASMMEWMKGTSESLFI